MRRIAKRFPKDNRKRISIDVDIADYERIKKLGMGKIATGMRNLIKLSTNRVDKKIKEIRI